MSVRFARALTLAYLVAYACAVTWPGMLPFNRIQPLILGLPFSMVWIAIWIIGGCLVLWMLDHVESSARERRRPTPHTGD